MADDERTRIASGAADAAIGSLDFDRAERSAPACAQCATPIAERYFTLGSHVLCESCHLRFQHAKAPGEPVARFFGAAGLGAIAAALGCALWMLATQLTGYEIGLIAIAIGYGVGMAVQFGARRVGGLPYQLLAVFFTYSAIVMTYVPHIANGLLENSDFQRELELAPSADSTGEQAAGEEWTGRAGEDFAAGANDVETQHGRVTDSDANLSDANLSDGSLSDPDVSDPELRVTESDARVTAAWIAAVPIAYATPVLLGFDNAIGILIIGFALWQAFRMNARVKIELQGPFRLEAHNAARG